MSTTASQSSVEKPNYSVKVVTTDGLSFEYESKVIPYLMPTAMFVVPVDATQNGKPLGRTVILNPAAILRIEWLTDTKAPPPEPNQKETP